MAYNKTNWKDRVIQRPNTFRLQNNTDGTVTLIPVPGTVTEQGTPVNASNLNKIENELVGLESSLAEIATKVPQLREIYNNGSSECDLSLYSFITGFDVKSNNTVIQRMAIDVLMFETNAMIEIAVFDKNLNKVLTSDKQEIVALGINQFSMPYAVLNAGSYYFAVTGYKKSILRGDAKKGYLVNKAYPLPDATLNNLYEYSVSPCFELYSYDLPAPTGFEFQNRPQYRVFFRSAINGKVYGWNTSTGRICVSTDSGATFTDLMRLPSGQGVWALQVDDANGKIYFATNDFRVFMSSGLTANDSFSEITPPMKNTKATMIPTAFLIWNGYLWVGEYSGALGELDGVVQVMKFNLTSGTWLLSKAFDNCRHVHSFTANGTSALYVTMGDANYGANVGIHRMTTINPSGEDTWTRWTGHGGNNTTHYPVDNILANLDGNQVLLGAGDRPKLHLTTIKTIGTTVGSANINARLFGFPDSGAGETVRNVILDDELNCYYVTAETDKPRICVSPYPWVQSYILQELSGLTVFTTPICRAGEWIMFHTFRFHTVTFGSKKAITISKRNYLYNNGEVVPFTSGSSGGQTSNANKNTYSLFLEAISTLASPSQKTGYYTNSQIDLTNYKSIFVEGEYIGCKGTNYLRIKVDTVTTIDGNVKEILYANSDLHVNQQFVQKLDISSVTGLHHVHVQAVSSGVDAKGTIKVSKIWLSEI